MDKKELGDIGEAMASSFLIDHGMEIIGRQVRVGRGEIDLVMQDGEELVFVEVKTRQSNAFGNPEESVTRRKLERILRMAQIYLKKEGLECPWRIDVVAINLSEKQSPIHYIVGVA